MGPRTAIIYRRRESNPPILHAIIQVVAAAMECHATACQPMWARGTTEVRAIRKAESPRRTWPGADSAKPSATSIESAGTTPWQHSKGAKRCVPLADSISPGCRYSARAAEGLLPRSPS